MKQLLAAWLVLAPWILCSSAGAEAELTSRASERIIYDSPLSAGLDIAYVSTTYPNYLWSGASKESGGSPGNGLHLALEWLPFGEINIGKLGIGFGAGYNVVSSIPYGNGGLANLVTVPLEAFLSYRFDYFRQQILVPFVKVGPSLTLSHQTTRQGPARDGWYTFPGLDLVAGAQLCLSRLEPKAARSLDQNFGINDTYIVFEYQRTTTLSQKQALVNLSHQEFRLGLRFEM